MQSHGQHFQTDQLEHRFTYGNTPIELYGYSQGRNNIYRIADLSVLRTMVPLISSLLPDHTSCGGDIFMIGGSSASQ